MMNSRSSIRESLIGAGVRNFPFASSHSHNHRRGHSLNGFSKDTDEKLDLFSKNRRSLSLASSDDSSDVSAKLGPLSVGSAKPAKSGIDDLLASTEGGKHDYDWLLTPPGTPLFPSSDASETQPTVVAPRTSSLSRSISASKTSRLSVSQSESHHSTRPARSSSVARSSISSSHFTSYSSNRSTSILNTSSASVSSYIRPSSPVMRSPSTARPSTPSSRPSVSRPSTPSRARPAPNNSLTDKTRPSQSSRPSTPTSRAQISSSISLSATRSNSRPSTPTRRNSAPSTLPSSGTSTSAGRIPSNGRIPGPASRPSSPGPRLRAPQQPIIPHDFSLDTPPNLRTTLPDRPLSASRSRPGAATTVKATSETTGSANVSRRPSPIMSRGRLSETPTKRCALSNGHGADVSDSRKVPNSPDMGMRKPIRSMSTTSEGNGFGRTISKKSLDMAVRHMDIKNGTGSNRAPSSTSLFPQSVRSAPKTQSVRYLAAATESISNGHISENGYHTNWSAGNEMDENESRYSGKLREVDTYESSRYDAMLLKEDSRNTNWLHSIDDKSDAGTIFDHGFEPLPEPFAPL